MENFKLDNGLAVYIHPKRIGYAAVYVGINSGSWQDTLPELAHTTEHVVGVASRVYGERGVLNYARSNATTSPTRTIYYFNDILPQHLQLGVNNLVEVFSLPNINVLAREKDAVRNELKPRLHPLSMFSEKVSKKLFPVYAGRMPKIQERLRSLEKITPEDIVQFWNDHYTTHNAFVYIAGELPLSLDAILCRLEQIPSRGSVKQNQKFEEEKALTERVEFKELLREDGVASVEIDYQAPSFPHSCTVREQVAIKLLDAYLSADHGLLYQRMRDEKRLCYSLNVNYNTDLPFISSLSFSAMTQPELHEQLEKEWITAIKDIAKKGVEDDVLETFKNKAQIGMIHISQGCDVGSVILKIECDLTREDIQKEITNLTSQDIAKAAQTFAERHYVISIALPKAQ